VELQSGAEMVMSGNNAVLTVALQQAIALEEHTRFAIREGNRTVGAGLVTRILAWDDDIALGERTERSAPLVCSQFGWLTRSMTASRRPKTFKRETAWSGSEVMRSLPSATSLPSS
jgi:hypothetical protein